MWGETLCFGPEAGLFLSPGGFRVLLAPETEGGGSSCLYFMRFLKSSVEDRTEAWSKVDMVSLNI